jgi:hypothetical protein
LVSQPRCDINANDTGAVYLYEWESLPTEPTYSYITTADATETLRGSTGSEYFGYSIATGDFDGDQDLDLAVGAYNAEAPGGPNNAGALRVFLYDQETGAYESEPAQVMYGEDANHNLGESVAILGAGHVASFAFGVDELGYNVGMPYWGELVEPEATPEDPEPALTLAREPLEYSADLGYGRFGTSFDLSDEGQDNVIDVIVGASYLSTESVGVTRAGSGFIYQVDDLMASPNTEESALNPTQNLQGFRGHSGYDLLGEGAKFIGDFDGDGYGDVALVARAEEQPTSFNNQDTLAQGGCPNRQSDAGAVYIFRGRAQGDFESEPSFVVFGQRSRENLEVVDGRIDMNNDQRADLLVGARFADIRENGSTRNDAGRAAIFLGRPAPADGTRLVICEEDAELLGETGSSRLGWSVSAIGDLNQDGCAEAAFGQPELRIENRNRQGAVHIVYGWGGAGCFAQPRVLSLTARDAEARFGTSIAAADLDLDGVSDLVIGGFNARVNNERRGVVWIVRASQLQTLAPLTLDQARVMHEVNNWVGAQGEWQLNGLVNGSRFGWSVGAVSGYVLVGIPWLGQGGARSGGAHLYRVGANGVEGLSGVFSGETFNRDSELGRAVDLARTGNRVWLGLGSLWGRGTHTQGGSVYVGDFTP